LTGRCTNERYTASIRKGDETMGLQDQDSEFIDWYESSEQAQIDQALFDEWSNRVYENGEQLGVHFDQSYQNKVNAATARLNALWDYKDTQTQKEAETKVEMLQSELNPALADANQQVYDEMTQQLSEANGANLEMPQENASNGEDAQYSIAPNNPVFIDAELSDEDISNGYTLQYNPNGIKWRVNAAEEPHPDDLYKFYQQQEIHQAYSDNLAAKFSMIFGTPVAGNNVEVVATRLSQGSSNAAKEIGVVAKEASNNYKVTFFTKHPELEGKVVVHHSVEQQVLKRPETMGLFTKEEINAYNNLRGIPKEINSKLHLSEIRKEWNEFYRNNPFPSKEDLLVKSREIDMKYGELFNPPIE